MSEEHVDLPVVWTPREYQLDLWLYLRDGGRRADVVGHRRWNFARLNIASSTIPRRRKWWERCG